MILENTVSVSRQREAEKGGILLTLRTDRVKKFFLLLEENGIPKPETVGYAGFPVYLRRWKKRPGVPAGALLAMVILFLSSRFVWRVDVICLDNETCAREEEYVDTEAVKKRLAEFGVTSGMPLYGFSARSAENRYLIGQTEVSWMAINRHGTVLSVEVRPGRAVPDTTYGALKRDGEYLVGANLVADSEGMIVRYEVQNAKTLYLPGDTVTKGQMIAAGMLENNRGDVAFSYAGGKVFAQTIRTFSETIPLTLPETGYTGRTEREKTFRFFGKDVTFLEILRKILPKGGNFHTDCDIIKDEYPLRLPDGTELPIRVTQKTFYEKETRYRVLSEEEAKRLAMEKINARIAASPDLTVLSRETEFTEEDGEINCTVRVYGIDNIACVSEYRLDARDVQRKNNG